MEQLWLQVKSEKDSFLLAVFYQPSSVLADKRIWLQKLESLIAYVNTTWTGPIILTGDTNINLLKKDTELYNQYSDTLANLGLKQHNNQTNKKRRKVNRPHHHKP